jgi:hypothetical protein
MLPSASLSRYLQPRCCLSMSKDEKIEYLEEFFTRNKFSTQAWNERGLNPSDQPLCRTLTTGFNETALFLIQALQLNKRKSQLKSILLKSIDDCKTLGLDTEEKEFAVDLYMELSYVLEIDLRFRLSVFLYGYFLTFSLVFVKFIKPERVRKVLSQLCARCNTPLIAHVMKIEHGIPDRNWTIGKCNNCGEYNLFSHGPNIKLLRYKTYHPIEYLPKEEFTYDQAITRLEQIKYFKK